MSEENRLRVMSLKERKLLEQMMADNPFVVNNIPHRLVKDAFDTILISAVVSCLLFGLLYFTELSDISEITMILGFWWAIGLPIQLITDARKSYQQWKGLRHVYVEDLNTGQVKESNYHIVGVKVGQYPDSYGVVYFLLLADRRVFVLWDDKDATRTELLSNFVICSNLNIVRTKLYDWVIGIGFSGHVMPVSQTFKLSDQEDDWPEDEEFCDVPWDEIEKRYRA